VLWTWSTTSPDAWDTSRIGEQTPRPPESYGSVGKHLAAVLLPPAHHLGQFGAHEPVVLQRFADPATTGTGGIEQFDAVAEEPQGPVERFLTLAGDGVPDILVVDPVGVGARPG